MQWDGCNICCAGDVLQKRGGTMTDMTPNEWSDERLEAIISETGDWALVGINDQLICRAASFGHAIDRALDEVFGPHVVIALVRRPCDQIAVFTGQMFRIWERIVTRQMPKGCKWIPNLPFGEGPL
jgi:hypothetical protein